MAPWIIHLRLAEYLLQSIPDLDSAYFAIGNVAPDSGIPDEHYETFDPPTQISHFHAPVGSKYPIADLDFFKNYLDPVSVSESSVVQYSFLLGYFFHLVTDILWFEEIDKPTRARFHEEFEADPKFIWEVKRDWYGLDLDFVRKNPESLYWTVFLKAQYDHDYLPFMPPHAIQRRIDEIKELYQRTDEEIEGWYGRRPDKYLSKKEYDQFVSDNAPRLQRAYQVLIMKGASVDERLSVLELAI